MNQKMFSKDFTLVIVGQIISLFGNAAVRFALPLYLLNQTGSGALYGAVTACAFIPSILLSPIGGMIADRVNKRSIMVVLDFSTAALILVFCLLMDRISLVLLLTVTLMLLYGIAGAYQPSVQASIPLLVRSDAFMQANSVINGVSSLASLLGPVLGGILYSMYGLKTVLYLCIICFTLSAVMELFIKIPYEKPDGGPLFSVIRRDFSASLCFVRQEKPIIGKCLLIVCAINFLMSAMIVVALPYLITEVLPFSAALANRLCGFAEGALAAGGIAGAVCAGVFAKKLSVKNAGRLLITAAALLLPPAAALALSAHVYVTYAVIVLCVFFIMAVCSVFTIQMISFVQAVTPDALLGKVISVILTVSMCAQPAGCALYGVLFELCDGFEFAVILFSAASSLAVSVFAKNIFRDLTL